MTSMQKTIEKEGLLLVPFRIVDDLSEKKFYLPIKRVLDLVLVTISLPLIIPILLLTSIVVWFDVGNPIIFMQKRHGKNLQLFTIYKFRTMKEHDFDFKFHDELISPIGKILRKYKFDELPQIWNVIIGNMSLIGPRPITEQHYEGIKKEFKNYDYRYLVKPGITGLAQVNSPHFLNVEGAYKQFLFDILYIKNQSFILDVIIILKTFAVIFEGKLSK